MMSKAGMDAMQQATAPKAAAKPRRAKRKAG
jgi:hypothetical protein